jgi:hypothetical protein
MLAHYPRGLFLLQMRRESMNPLTHHTRRILQRREKGEEAEV